MAAALALAQLAVLRSTADASEAWADEVAAAVVASLGAAVERVEVLPFHKMGEAKWVACGVPYTLGNTPPPTPEATEGVRTRFRSFGLKVF